MAKIGLEYFRLDTNRYQDIRIKRLKKEHGCEGLAVYDYILTEIYRVKGCYLEWSDDVWFDVADYLGLEELRVSEIANTCSEIGLFDLNLFRKGLVTSPAIQRRYLEMCNAAKRKDVKIPEEIEIIPEEMAKVPEETPKIPEEINKVKYSKVNKTKEKESKVIPTIEEFVSYGLEFDSSVSEKALEAKYNSYVENDWKDGYNNPIKNWKTKIQNVIPHLKKNNQQNQQQKQPELSRFEQALIINKELKAEFLNNQ